MGEDGNSLIEYGIYSLCFLIIMGIVGSIGTSFSAFGDGSSVACTNPDNEDDVYCKSIPQRNSIQVLNCPFPVWDNGTSGYYFECGSNTTGDFMNTLPRNYTSENTFGIPTGWFSFTADNVVVAGSKLSSILFMIASFITPIGFNIFGFTFADISSFASLILWTVYIVAYTFIGIMMYKVISPFV